MEPVGRLRICASEFIDGGSRAGRLPGAIYFSGARRAILLGPGLPNFLGLFSFVKRLQPRRQPVCRHLSLPDASQQVEADADDCAEDHADGDLPVEGEFHSRGLTDVNKRVV